MSHKRILVSGVANQWGNRVAARLAAEPELRVVGLDTKPPPAPIDGLHFIQADVRTPQLAQLLQAEAIKVFCHLNLAPTFRFSEAAFDLNVMGTLKVLGACAEADVQRIVLKSSTMVYGAHPSNPAFITEKHPLRGSRRYPPARYLVEVESLCQEFHRRTSPVSLTILRFANVVGPTVDTPMTRFLQERCAPVLLGFDPMMQVIHEDDVVEALAHAVIHGVSGPFNVAAPDPLPLRRLVGLAGKLPLPLLHPLAYWGSSLLGRNHRRLTRYAPLDWDYLRYRWVGDLAKMQQELGFAPRHTAQETLRAFAGQRRRERYAPKSVKESPA